MEVEKSAGFVVFRRENGNILFLLLEYTNYFDFPRGNLEESEDELKAAKRELFEETGIKNIKVIPFFKENVSWFYVKENIKTKKIVTYFLCEALEKNIKLSFEHRSYKWLSYEDAKKTLTFENSRKILDKAYEFIKKIIKE